MKHYLSSFWNSSLFFIILSILWMGTITYVSSQRRSELTVTKNIYNFPHKVAYWWSGTNAPSGVWQKVVQVQYGNILDKPLHMMEYALLMFLLWRSIFCLKSMPVQSRAVWLAGLFALVFASLDEFHQSFVPGREFRFVDLVANMVGILLVGIVLEYIFHRKQMQYYTGEDEE